MVAKMKIKFGLLSVFVVVAASGFVFWLIPRPVSKLVLPDKTVCWVELKRFSQKEGSICVSLRGSLLHVVREFEATKCKSPRYSLQLDERQGIVTLTCCETELIAVVDATSKEIAVEKSKNSALWRIGLDSIIERGKSKVPGPLR